MNENIISQVYGVLNKYNKTYTPDGVMKNLNTWERNKSPLIELLRKHPNWNEEALAVIFEVTQSREIDRYNVNTNKYDVFRLSADLSMASDDIANLNNSLDYATSTFTKLLPDENIVSNIKQYSGVSCAIGQKTSRAVNKICQRYGLDKHPEYNARFAKLADSLNPMLVKRKALLSVHPCDFLEMSNENNSWSSCHCIRDGEYHGGTLSYMNDSVSMIFYTVDDDVCDTYYSAPKRTRQVFCYGDGILLQSRLYPQTDDEETRDIYRDIVQRTIAYCLDMPNLWTLKRSHDEVERYCFTHDDSLHYTDYAYQCYKPNVSLLKSIYADKSIIIGNTAYCLECAKSIDAHNSMLCDRCNDDGYVTCYDCGERVYEDDVHYIDGEYYCDSCSSYCEECNEYTRDDMTHVHDRHGHIISVCESCCENLYYYCEDCGKYYHSSGGESLDDGFHCYNCLAENYFKCVGCGEFVPCANAEEINEEFYCTDCADLVRADIDCLITA